MSKIKCELLCNSNSGHLQLIYTGFRLLSAKRKIKLSYIIIKEPISFLDYPAPVHLFAKVNDSILICFDMTDFGEIRNDILEYVDFYFKRSYSSKIAAIAKYPEKVYPLGLHYKVYEKFPSVFSLKRSFLEESNSSKLKTFFRELIGPVNNIYPDFYRLHIDNCSAKPDHSLKPGIIFMAALWDPALTKKKYWQQREEINKMRVECVRKLKKTFGNRFMGGLRHNEFTKKNFPDCLLEDPSSAVFGNYMRTLEKYPIGVATTGLHNSIGWKFAEYVAFSHAIVSENMYYEAPGLKAGKHYLEFKSADECVEKAGILMENYHLRHEMMEANHFYYQNYLKPDVLVWRALSISLENN